MQDLKKQLQGLEASSKQLTVKEQVAINETIMNLLLSLDSIQVWFFFSLVSVFPIHKKTCMLGDR
jgi:hypothetical protein